MKIRVYETEIGERSYLNAVPFDEEETENPMYRAKYPGLNGLLSPETEEEKLYWLLNKEKESQESGNTPNEDWDSVEIFNLVEFLNG
nr:MAG TPA: hypothetical protein [Caudoviricetes sp.]